jgi:hypothetical protein
LYSIFSIDAAIERGIEQKLDSIVESNSFNKLSEKYMSIDQAFSTSKFAIMVAEFVRAKGQIRILHSIELERSLYEEALDEIMRIRKRFGNVLNIAVDNSSRELISSLKKHVGERYDWNYIQDKIKHCKKYSWILLGI